MKNNEILLILDQGDSIAQYVFKVDCGITYQQLMEGIKYGFGGTIDTDELKIYNTIAIELDKQRITIESYREASKKNLHDLGLSNRTLRQLGFVTGTVLSTTGIPHDWFFEDLYLRKHLFSKRYSVEEDSTKKTMKYNITNRTITEMEETVIEVLSPGNPPRLGNNSIFDVIMPTLISFGIMYGLRYILVPNAGTGMIAFMICSALGTFLAQAFRFERNKKKFKEDTASWKFNYENYLERLCQKIEDYQAQDILFLSECFPSIEKLIQRIDQISDIILFSRSINDFDFMEITLGTSKHVPSLFTIHHERKEGIELGTTFYIDNGKIKIKLVDQPPHLPNWMPNWLENLLLPITNKFIKLAKFKVGEMVKRDQVCESINSTEFQLVAINDLKIDTHTYSPEQITKLRFSLREFGFINPIIIDRDHKVIAGHDYIIAAKAEGMMEVPCVLAEENVRYLNELSEYLANERYPYLKIPKFIPKNGSKTDEESADDATDTESNNENPKKKDKSKGKRHQRLNNQGDEHGNCGAETQNNVEYVYPPLVIDFKNCGALGCVDFGDELTSLLDHIILELAAYHNPQDLQFVFFFSPKKKNDNGTFEVLNECDRQKRIQNYRCLPHFNELFDGISQFVFDEESAGIVFSKLESIMNERMLDQQAQDEEKIAFDKYRQIVCIFEYDYKLKEKAFSKYLPLPPKQGESYINRNGLTFLFAVEYKELLPPYCGVILKRRSREESNGLYLYGTAEFRNQIRRRKKTDQTSTVETQQFEDLYIFGKKDEEYRKAFAQLSAFYSLHIQERGSVPEKVTLFGLYPEQLKSKIDALPNDTKVEGAIDILTDYIKWQWSESDKSNTITKDLKVPIGCGESGNVYLDLHEHNDGPHMLVAGTTGSGKSEMMLTYLIGLCMRFSPQYLNLMLVDMKGNSFAGRLKELPHCVATVDNVSSEKSGVSPVYMLKRFLEILKAEIKRRELIFEEYGVDKLDDYIEYEKQIYELLKKHQPLFENLKNKYLAEHGLNDRRITEAERKKITQSIIAQLTDSLSAFKSKQQAKIKHLIEINTFNVVKKYPPVLGHLVFVVDEFTELKRFGSETDTNYIDELTSIARVGRTLGLHMVLVSQNIENAITDDIRVNTRSRICLKVATRSASKEMLDGRTDAYYSDMPQGRAFFLVGSGSTYEYFQSGYASEPIEEVSEKQTKIIRLNSSGEHVAFYDSYTDNPELSKIAESRNKENTQLNAVIKAIQSISKANSQLINDGDSPIYRVPNEVFYQPLDSSIKYSDFVGERKDATYGGEV